MISKFSNFHLLKNLNKTCVKQNPNKLLTSCYGKQTTTTTATFRYTKGRQFSTTPKRQFIPPLVWIVLKPISKITEMMIGRLEFLP